MSQNDLHDVKTDVAILKKDVSNIQGLLGRLDTAIDKIADATGGISQILTAHEQQLTSLGEDVGERKRLAERENDLLHQRISDMKDETSKLGKENHAAVMSKLTDMGKDIDTELKEVKARVTILERWKWWIMGGSWVIGFVIATILQVGGIIKLFT